MCFKTVAVAHWLAGWKMPAWSRFIAGVLAPLRGHKGLKSVRIRCGAPQHLLPSCASNRPLPQKQSWKSESDGCFIAGQLYRVKNKGHMYFSVMGCDSKAQCAPPLEGPYHCPWRSLCAAHQGPYDKNKKRQPFHIFCHFVWTMIIWASFWHPGFPKGSFRVQRKLEISNSISDHSLGH